MEAGEGVEIQRFELHSLRLRRWAKPDLLRVRPRSAKPVDQLAGFDAEPMRQLQDRGQPRLPTAALNPADRGRVDARRVRQPVLRNPFPRSQLTHPFPECSACSVGVFVERCGHRKEAWRLPTDRTRA